MPLDIVSEQVHFVSVSLTLQKLNVDVSGSLLHLTRFGIEGTCAPKVTKGTVN